MGLVPRTIMNRRPDPQYPRPVAWSQPQDPASWPDGPRLSTEQIEELIDRALRASNWRHRLLGHPRARLFIHRHHLVTLYPDGRMKITGPRRAS